MHDELPSTMDAAHALAATGAPAGSAVMARRQRSGRGRQVRSWSAEPGGLWLSVVGRPASAATLEPVSLRIGLALAEVLEREIAGIPPVQLKWPNDLLLDGRKVGGILVESRWQGEQCLWVVVGVGLNLRNAIPESLATRAIAVAELVPAPAPELLAPEVVRAVTTACRGGPLTTDELAAWDRRDALRGEAVAAPVAGVTMGVSTTGALRVRRPDGQVVEAPSGVVLPAN